MNVLNSGTCKYKLTLCNILLAVLTGEGWFKFLSLFSMLYPCTGKRLSLTVIQPAVYSTQFTAVSYTHLDVYKRQLFGLCVVRECNTWLWNEYLSHAVCAYTRRGATSTHNRLKPMRQKWLRRNSMCHVLWRWRKSMKRLHPPCLLYTSRCV